MKKAAFTCSKRFHIILFLVLSFFVEHNAWAQTDYSGTYYIVNHRISTNPNINYSGSTSNADKFFLVPAQTPQQIDKTDVYYFPHV